MRRGDPFGRSEGGWNIPGGGEAWIIPYAILLEPSGSFGGPVGSWKNYSSALDECGQPGSTGRPRKHCRGALGGSGCQEGIGGSWICYNSALSHSGRQGGKDDPRRN